MKWSGRIDAKRGKALGRAPRRMPFLCAPYVRLGSLADMALDVLDAGTPKADIALRVSARPGAARRCATIGGKTAQISQGRHRFGRADGKGLGQHPSLDLP